MISLIEHVRFPRQYIEKAYRLLNPEGILVVYTDNFSSPDAQSLLYQKNPPPEHISFFNSLSLKRILLTEGFSNVMLQNYGFPRYTGIWKYAVIRDNPLITLLGSLFFNRSPSLRCIAFKGADDDFQNLKKSFRSRTKRIWDIYRVLTILCIRYVKRQSLWPIQLHSLQ
jgi:hypothetical protein